MTWMIDGVGYMGATQSKAESGVAPTYTPAVTEPMNEEEELAARWRTVVLKLSDSFSLAATCQPKLAPYLLEALGNALEQLLLFGRERDLEILDEWLSEEAPA